MSLRERLGHATAGFGQNLVYKRYCHLGFAADTDETPFGVEEGGQVYWNVFWSNGRCSPSTPACSFSPP